MFILSTCGPVALTCKNINSVMSLSHKWKVNNVYQFDQMNCSDRCAQKQFWHTLVRSNFLLIATIIDIVLIFGAYYQVCCLVIFLFFSVTLRDHLNLSVSLIYFFVSVHPFFQVLPQAAGSPFSRQGIKRPLDPLSVNIYDFREITKFKSIILRMNDFVRKC